MAIGREILGLAEKIGYTFSDLSYLEVALTHSSYANEANARGMTIRSNERLEFLGDAVLELTVSEYLYENNGAFAEGALSQIRQKLVANATLAAAAKRIGIDEYLNLGIGEEKNRCNDKILACAAEALFAAVWFDSGRDLSAVRKVILDFLAPEIAAAGKPIPDPKTRLQNLIDGNHTSVLEYVVEEKIGPEHAPIYTVAAKIDNNVVGRGTDSKKQIAEMKAAEQALALFGVTRSTENDTGV